MSVDWVAIDGWVLGEIEAGAARALVGLVEQCEEHGWRDGNTFDAAWLEAYARCSRRDVYRLGALCGVHRDEGDSTSTVHWIGDDGESCTMEITYSRGTFRVREADTAA